MKHKEIAEYRNTQLLAQNNRCALCNEIIDGDAVLDHDHKTGLIRKVLHRGCNAMLGKIENNMPRNRINKERLREFANNLLAYIETPHTDIVHPRHRKKKK